MTLSERQMIGWLNTQLGSNAQNQATLCAAFQKEFGQSGETLVDFLIDSKYFRKTGVDDASSWSISANRKDDLRDYLAD